MIVLELSIFISGFLLSGFLDTAQFTVIAAVQARNI